MKWRVRCLLLFAILAGSFSTNGTAGYALVVDDGTQELTPVYITTHTQGQNFTFVRAAFWVWDAKQSVELPASGEISVNGFKLKKEFSQGSFSYVGDVPVTGGKVTFRLVRGNGAVMEHSFELPLLDIPEYPKTYMPYASLRVPVRYGPPTPGETVIAMDLETPHLWFPFESRAEGDNVEFTPILHLNLPSGTYPATICRQQTIPLRDLSNATSTGWVVSSDVREFMIEIVNK